MFLLRPVLLVLCARISRYPSALGPHPERFRSVPPPRYARIPSAGTPRAYFKPYNPRRERGESYFPDIGISK
jgi:hypothetical protein